MAPTIFIKHLVMLLAIKSTQNFDLLVVPLAKLCVTPQWFLIIELTMFKRNLVSQL